MALCGQHGEYREPGTSISFQLQVEGESETEEVEEGEILEGLLRHVKKFELNPKDNEWEANKGF